MEERKKKHVKLSMRIQGEIVFIKRVKLPFHVVVQLCTRKFLCILGGPVKIVLKKQARD